LAGFQVSTEDGPLHRETLDGASGIAFWGTLAIVPSPADGVFDPYFCPVCVDFYCPKNPSLCTVDFGTVVVTPQDPPAQMPEMLEISVP
jgi:hypothetical protein